MENLSKLEYTTRIIGGGSAVCSGFSCGDYDIRHNSICGRKIRARGFGLDF